MKRVFILLMLAVSVNSFAELEDISGVFTLYGEPSYEPTGACDNSMQLTLDKARLSGRVAFVKDQVEGRCRLFVNPNNRHYFLTKSMESCGSTVYQGTRYTFDGLHSIEIVDHRTRECEDMPPALIMVTEKGPNYVSYHYSSDF